MNPLVCIIIYAFSLLCIAILWGIKTKWMLSSSLYLFFFLSACGFTSVFFYTVSDGIFRDYQNITMQPFVYLIFCYIVTMAPLLQYDNKIDKCFIIYDNQHSIIKSLSLLLIVLMIEPFIEMSIKLPQALSNSNYMATMYEATGEKRRIMSALGTKLFNICAYFELLYPIFLLYNLIYKRINKFLLYGMVIVITGYWFHEILLGGRSKLVQNILYIIVVYLIMRPYINAKRNKVILKYGMIILSLGFAGMFAITISRYILSSSTSYDSVWAWLSLYVGEGPLNFNSSMWYITQNTHGGSSFPLFTYLLGLSDRYEVLDQWNLVDSLGIQGNIFYTYVGVFFSDFGKIATFVYLLIFSLITSRLTKMRKCIYLHQIILLCLCARIICLPTFYTYGTFMAQINLVVALTVCFIIFCSKQGKIRYI